MTFTVRDAAMGDSSSECAASKPLVNPEAGLTEPVSGDLSPEEREDVLGLALVLILFGVLVAMAGAHITEVWMEVCR